MNRPPQIWKEAEQYTPLLPDGKIIPLNPRESEKLFLDRYYELCGLKQKTF